MPTRLFSLKQNAYIKRLFKDPSVNNFFSFLQKSNINLDRYEYYDVISILIYDFCNIL